MKKNKNKRSAKQIENDIKKCEKTAKNIDFLTKIMSFLSKRKADKTKILSAFLR